MLLKLQGKEFEGSRSHVMNTRQAKPISRHFCTALVALARSLAIKVFSPYAWRFEIHVQMLTQITYT